MSGSTGAVVSSIRSAVRSSRQAKPKAVHPVTAKRAFSTSNRLSVEGDAAESSTSRSATSSSSSAVEAGETHEEAWKRNMKEVREWRRRKESQRSKLPLFLPPYVKSPPSPSPLRLSLSTLLASGAALGHSSSSLSPAFMPYTYGTRSGLSIIDLDQTLPILRRTAAMIRDVVRQDGVVLVVGSRTGHERLLRRARERMGDSVYTVEEWMPGTLTNSVTFFGVEPMTKKSHLPDIAIFLNPSENLGAIRECTAKNVPTVGIVDSDTDPRIVTYPIPANMESIRTAELILSTLSIAGEEGRRLLQSDRQEKLRKAREAEARRVAKQKEASNLRDR